MKALMIDPKHIRNVYGIILHIIRPEGIYISLGWHSIELPEILFVSYDERHMIIIVKVKQ